MDVRRECALPRPVREGTLSDDGGSSLAADGDLAPVSTDARLLALNKIDLFKGLPQSVLDDVTRSVTLRDVAAEADILSYLDQSTDVHFLVAGSARVIIHSASGREVVFVDMGPGQVFGELAAIDKMPRSASVMAVTNTTVAKIPASAFVRLIETHPAVAMALIRKLTADLRRMVERVLEFSTLNVPGRIQAELLRQADLSPAGRSGADNVLLAPGPSLADLASRVSTHREAVSRELSRLAGLNLVKREKAGLRILSRDGLRALVEQAKLE
jgi:CRP/FNR family transcriptional regulator, cyclic AMP receptor protein